MVYMSDSNEINVFNRYGNIVNSRVATPLYVNPMFPNNFMISIYNGILNYLKQNVPREINYSLITTYQRGMELINQYQNKNISFNENHYPLKMPALILQPGPLKIDERINNTWHTESTMSEMFARSYLPPYLKIGNLGMWVVTNRFTTSFEVFYIGESYLEIQDMYFHINRLFNTRYKYLKQIARNSIMIPHSVTENVIEMYGENLFEYSDKISLRYHSQYNRTFYTTDWLSNVHLKVSDMSDGSNYLGDVELPSFKLNISFEMFFQLPNHLIFGFENSFDTLVLDMDVIKSKTPTKLNINIMRQNKDEQLLVNIYDDYPSDFEISLNKTQFNLSEFKSFFIRVIGVNSGLIDIYENNSEHFSYEYQDSEIKFYFKSIPDNKVIELYGVFF